MRVSRFRLVEDAINTGPPLVIETLVVEKGYTDPGQRRAQLLFDEFCEGLCLPVEFIATQAQFLRRIQPVGGAMPLPAFHLSAKPAHPFHHELVVNHPQNPRKLHTLEEGHVRILGYLQYTVGELKPAQFPIDEAVLRGFGRVVFGGGGQCRSHRSTSA
ncbi:MAG: hypothetical protein QF768_13175 [Candidatus Latescibacteria bacterium]|jgi:hypothetical protein|nr:hypothetical protein [Candidatus Latescibacterota bacterium]|tara:strand:+ start:93 stop:569 length:477 start_codon:yes stop_codon:yes gene_type:complete